MNKKSYNKYFGILLETILFSVNLDESESELAKHSLAYLIFKWYQAHYLYNVLTNPNYQREEVFGGRYWIVYYIQESIPRLEQYIKRIGKLIYKKSKPIFLDWATGHDVEHFKNMMKERLSEVEPVFGSLYRYIWQAVFPQSYLFAPFLEEVINNKGKIYPFEAFPQATKAIIGRVKKLFIDCNVKSMLEDYVEELKDDLEEARKEDDVERIENLSKQIRNIKEYIDKSEKQWTMNDIYNIYYDVILKVAPNFFIEDIYTYKDNYACQEDIVWLHIVHSFKKYFERKGYNELPQWMDKVRIIRKLFKYNYPPNDLKELILLIEKIIHFAHNNGHLLTDHISHYDEDIKPDEYKEIKRITGKPLYNLLSLLNYFAKNEYQDPELVKTLKQYKNYYVPQEKKENKLK